MRGLHIHSCGAKSPESPLGWRFNGHRRTIVPDKVRLSRRLLKVSDVQYSLLLWLAGSDTTSEIRR